MVFRGGICQVKKNRLRISLVWLNINPYPNEIQDIMVPTKATLTLGCVVATQELMSHGNKSYITAHSVASDLWSMIYDLALPCPLLCFYFGTSSLTISLFSFNLGFSPMWLCFAADWITWASPLKACSAALCSALVTLEECAMCVHMLMVVCVYGFVSATWWGSVMWFRRRS